MLSFRYAKSIHLPLSMQTFQALYYNNPSNIYDVYKMFLYVLFVWKTTPKSLHYFFYSSQSKIRMSVYIIPSILNLRRSWPFSKMAVLSADVRTARLLPVAKFNSRNSNIPVARVFASRTRPGQFLHLPSQFAIALLTQNVRGSWSATLKRHTAWECVAGRIKKNSGRNLFHYASYVLMEIKKN